MTKEIDAQIERLEKQIAELQAKKAVWPKKCKIYLHSDKESNYETGEEIGVKGAALDSFAYTLYEVAFEGAVDEKGDFWVYSVGGVLLTKPTVM